MTFNIPAADSNGRFFTGNLEDIIISDIAGDTVNIETKFSKNGQLMATISEKYVKDLDGKVTLHDFRSVIDPLFDDAAKDGMNSIVDSGGPIRMQINAEDASTSKSQDYWGIYSSGKLDYFPSTFTFFYTLARNRKVYNSAPLFVAAPFGLNFKAGLAYRKEDGTPAWMSMTYTGNGGSYSFSCSSLARLIDPNSSIKNEDCIYAEFELLDTDGNVVDKLKYTFIEHGHKEEHDTFLFTNFFGHPEILTMKGFSSESLVISSELARMNGSLSKYDDEIIVENQAFTGNMSEEEYALFQDLIHSRSLNILYDDPNGIRLALSKKVVITDIDVLRERHSKQIQSARINYRYAERNQRTAKLEYLGETRIFDNSFNPSFE